MQRLLHLMVVIPMACVLGCGPTELELAPVTGKVVFPDGKPVVGAMIEFADLHGSGARGKTDADGRFELTTGGRKGAVVGTHRVAVVHMIIADGAAAHVKARHARLVIHPKYATFETSGLHREVKAGPNDFILELDAAEEKSRGW